MCLSWIISGQCFTCQGPKVVRFQVLPQRVFCCIWDLRTQNAWWGANSKIIPAKHLQIKTVRKGCRIWACSFCISEQLAGVASWAIAVNATQTIILYLPVFSPLQHRVPFILLQFNQTIGLIHSVTRQHFKFRIKSLFFFFLPLLQNASTLKKYGLFSM